MSTRVFRLEHANHHERFLPIGLGVVQFGRIIRPWSGHRTHAAGFKWKLARGSQHALAFESCIRSSITVATFRLRLLNLAAETMTALDVEWPACCSDFLSDDDGV